MSITNIVDRYQSQALTKFEFINLAYDIHKSLFEYSDYLNSTDIKSINITDDGVFFTTRKYDVSFLVNCLDKRIAPIEIMNFKHYELFETELICTLMADCSVFFDIGANIGWYSCVLGKKFDDLTIFAFEPIHHTFQSLLKNIELNQLTNIKSFNMGFSHANESKDFFYDPLNSGCSSLKKIAQQDFIKVEVQLKTLDCFFEENMMTHLDFIKCDVEGAELFVIQGGLKTIKECLPIIFIELLRKWAAKFDYSPSEVMKLLSDIGYEIYEIYLDKCQLVTCFDDSQQGTNYICLHKEKHAHKIASINMNYTT